MIWYDELVKDAEECRRKARETTSPNLAQQWYEAAEAAMKAAMASLPSQNHLTIISPGPPSAPPTCPICHQLLSLCRGHITCGPSTNTYITST